MLTDSDFYKHTLDSVRYELLLSVNIYVIRLWMHDNESDAADAGR